MTKLLLTPKRKLLFLGLTLIFGIQSTTVKAQKGSSLSMDKVMQSLQTNPKN